MELFTILFNHYGGRFQDLLLQFTSSPGEPLLATIKKDFSALESVLHTVYEATEFEKKAKNKHTADGVEVGFDYNPGPHSDERMTSFTVCSYEITGLQKSQGILRLNINDQEERILRIYDAVLAIPELTVDEQVKPIQQRIALLREGKRGEELLQALGYR